MPASSSCLARALPKAFQRPSLLPARSHNRKPAACAAGSSRRSFLMATTAVGTATVAAAAAPPPGGAADQPAQQDVKMEDARSPSPERPPAPEFRKNIARAELAPGLEISRVIKVSG